MCWGGGQDLKAISKVTLCLITWFQKWYTDCLEGLGLEYAPFPLPPSWAGPSRWYLDIPGQSPAASLRIVVGSKYPQPARPSLRSAGDREHDKSEEPYRTRPESSINPRTTRMSLVLYMWYHRNKSIFTVTEDLFSQARKTKREQVEMNFPAFSSVLINPGLEYAASTSYLPSVPGTASRHPFSLHDNQPSATDILQTLFSSLIQ